MVSDEERYIRAPLTGLIRKSPFDGLLDHAEKVEECILLLKEGMEAYCREEYDRFEGISKRIAKVEHEADLIKGNIRAHLPRNVFLMVDKSHFLTCLREEDSILDYAEDASVWLSFRRDKIPNQIKDDFLEHLQRVVECVDAYQRAIKEIKGAIRKTSKEGKRDKVKEGIKEAIKEVHRKEWEADTIEHKLTSAIFGLDADPLAIYHLLKVVELIGEIANHTENAGDWLRVMIAK